MHEGTAYLGTVRVRHSLVGMDIAGSVLVVHVDRPLRPEDPAGIPERGIDWSSTRLSSGSTLFSVGLIPAGPSVHRLRCLDGDH